MYRPERAQHDFELCLAARAASEKAQRVERGRGSCEQEGDQHKASNADRHGSAATPTGVVFSGGTMPVGMPRPETLAGAPATRRSPTLRSFNPGLAQTHAVMVAALEAWAAVVTPGVWTAIVTLFEPAAIMIAPLLIRGADDAERCRHHSDGGRIVLIFMDIHPCLGISCRRHHATDTTSLLNGAHWEPCVEGGDHLSGGRPENRNPVTMPLALLFLIMR
jgi:hypothetical protein